MIWRQQRAMRHPLIWLVAGGLAVFLLSAFSINTDVGSCLLYTSDAADE